MINNPIICTIHGIIPVVSKTLIKDILFSMNYLYSYIYNQKYIFIYYRSKPKFASQQKSLTDMSLRHPNISLTANLQNVVNV